MGPRDSSDLAKAQWDDADLPIRSKKPGSAGGEAVAPKQSQPNRSHKKKNASALDNAQTAEAQSNTPDFGNAAILRLPDFVVERNELFSELKRKHDAEILEKEHPVINVALDLGNDESGTPRPEMPVAAKAWESTPGSFLKHVDKGISSDVVVAKVDGKELWDLDRPLERDCRVSYIPFTSPEGRNVFWHSSAHVLGEAAECHYGCRLSHGPPVEQGFFYDMALAEG